jgi:hypothetical protein
MVMEQNVRETLYDMEQGGSKSDVCLRGLGKTYLERRLLRKFQKSNIVATCPPPCCVVESRTLAGTKGKREIEDDGPSSCIGRTIPSNADRSDVSIEDSIYVPSRSNGMLSSTAEYTWITRRNGGGEAC